MVRRASDDPARLPDFLAALRRDMDELARREALTSPRAVVTALGPPLTVRLSGATATEPVSRLRAYNDAAVGDVVLLSGAPGQWVALGAVV